MHDDVSQPCLIHLYVERTAAVQTAVQLLRGGGVIVKTELAVARAWILLVHAASCAKREYLRSDNKQQALPARSVISQLERPTNSGLPLALEVNP